MSNDLVLPSGHATALGIEVLEGLQDLQQSMSERGGHALPAGRILYQHPSFEIQLAPAGNTFGDLSILIRYTGSDRLTHDQRFSGVDLAGAFKQAAAWTFANLPTFVDADTPSRATGDFTNTRSGVFSLGGTSGIWSDGTTMYQVLALDSDTAAIYAYDMLTKARIDTHTITPIPEVANHRISGIVGGGDVIWVVNQRVGSNGQGTLQAWDLSARSRDAARDFQIDSPSFSADFRSGWYDGDEHVYMANDSSNGRTLEAFSVSDGRRSAALSFSGTVPGSQNHPAAVWSDGFTIWIGNENKLLAYELATRTRDEDKDITVAADAGGACQAFWSDGATMWVAGLPTAQDDGFFAYDLVTGERTA